VKHLVAKWEFSSFPAESFSCHYANGMHSSEGQTKFPALSAQLKYFITFSHSWHWILMSVPHSGQ
jgi:hypothetical protein